MSKYIKDVLPNQLSSAEAQALAQKKKKELYDNEYGPVLFRTEKINPAERDDLAKTMNDMQVKVESISKEKEKLKA